MTYTYMCINVFFFIKVYYCVNILLYGVYALK